MTVFSVLVKDDIPVYRDTFVAYIGTEYQFQNTTKL